MSARVEEQLPLLQLLRWSNIKFYLAYSTVTNTYQVPLHLLRATHSTMHISESLTIKGVPSGNAFSGRSTKDQSCWEQQEVRVQLTGAGVYSLLYFISVSL